MITIDMYTGRYQEALRPSAPRVGSKIRAVDTPDAREWDDVMRMLRKAGLDAEYETARGKWGIYRIVRKAGR